jgi:non-specific serine/threonine protein kinase
MTVHEFPPFRLDTAQQCLWRSNEGGGDQRILLPPTGFGVLCYLVEHAGKLVSEEELLAAVWPNSYIEPQAVKNRVFAIRKTLGDNVKTPRYIETLHRRGYQFIAPVLTRPSIDPQAPAHRNLPEQLTSFIGREKEIAELKGLLDKTRLLTLTGGGGCGKTRLAVRVAADASDAFSDGVWMAELAAQADARFVPQTVAQVLQVKEQMGTSLTQAIADFFVSSRALLILDNAEHLLSACALLADTLLRQCPRLTILVTSREPFAIGGELAYRVPSLSVPDPTEDCSPDQILTFESVRLFAERARLQRPHFSVTAENARALASICRRLDGIPLAIELAAARVRSMSVDEVNRRLDQRLGLLTGGSRTAPRRHQTLSAAIDWSFDLLSDAEQSLLCGLSVFSGGCGLDAAEAICVVDESTDVLEVLTSLADKNLIFTEERDGATRYGLLETLRQYARARLRDNGEEPEWGRRHLAHFIALAKRVEPLLRQPDQKAWLEVLEVEHGNLLAALAWASSAGTDAESGLWLAASLLRFWHTRGYAGLGRSWYAKLLANVPVGQAPAARAKALRGAGALAEQQGDFHVAKALLDESLALYRELGDRKGIAVALSSLGAVAGDSGHFDEARRCYEESSAIYRELGENVQVGRFLNNLGVVAQEQGDDQAASDFYLQSLKIHRESSQKDGVGTVLCSLGRMACLRGDLASARSCLEESLAIARELGDPWATAMSLANLAIVAEEEGDRFGSLALSRECLRLRRDQGDRLGIAWSLGGIAATSSRTEPHAAARLWGRAERLHQELGSPLPPRNRTSYERLVAAARVRLGDDAAFERAWQQGRAMTLEQAVAFALDTCQVPDR